MGADKKKEDDCPLELIKLANTKFERATVQEFVEVEAKMKEEFGNIKNEMKNVKYLLVVLLGLLVANFVRVISL
jgi:hypothetical protein